MPLMLLAGAIRQLVGVGCPSHSWMLMVQVDDTYPDMARLHFQVPFLLGSNPLPEGPGAQALLLNQK